MSTNGQFLSDLAIAEYFHLVEITLRQILRGEALQSHLSSIIKRLIDASNVDSKDRHRPAVVETTLRNTPEHWHRTTLEVGLATVATAALVTLVATSGSFAVPATWAATDSLPFAVLQDPAMDIVEVHGETRSNLISVTIFNLVSVWAWAQQMLCCPITVLKRLILQLPIPAVRRPVQQSAALKVRRMLP